MEQLHWPLSILSRAVHYKNLTGASAHVGLSQPQLSRLVAQLEKEYNVVLLDRSAKRKSGWTPAAFRLAEVYQSSSRKLQSAISEVLDDQVPKTIHVGTLEGLSGIALHIAHDLFIKTKITTIELDVYDLNELEEKFMTQDLDLIVTIRSPGKQKFKHNFEVGYQGMDYVQNIKGIDVLSPFELGTRKKKKSEADKNKLISNSLALRKSWIRNYKGSGLIPSKLNKNKGSSTSAVIVLAGEMFHAAIWREIEAINFSPELIQN